MNDRTPDEQSRKRRRPPPPAAGDSAHRSGRRATCESGCCWASRSVVICGPRSSRLLPRAEIHRRIPTRLPGGLPHPHPRWRGRQPRVRRFRTAVGDSAGDDRRGAAVSLHRGQVRARKPPVTAPTKPSRPCTAIPAPSAAGSVLVKMVASALTIGSGGSGRPRRPDGADLSGLLARCSPAGWACPTRTAGSRLPSVSARASARSSPRRWAERCWPRRSPTATTSTTAACCPVSSLLGRRTRCSDLSWVSTRYSATSMPSTASRGLGRCCGSW